MNAARLERIKEVHALALQVKDPADRRALLKMECGADSELRSEVESLLQAHERMGGFLDTPAPERVRRVATPALDSGERVGNYEIVRLLASGGGGTVYEALQENPRRKVAIKVLGVGLGSETGLRRFQDEAQMLAQLQHPDIATVFEAGLHHANGVGVPWFAMEYVEEARTVTQFANERGLRLRDRLRLMARICDAVHHGHQKGIIHRDIKPGNLLVDPTGRPKVIDFGIARLTGDKGAEGEFAGTVPYLSPEQCSLDESGVDVRSDVYSLGVVLYELLTGRLPHEVGGESVHEAARTIREVRPAAPSTRDRRLRGDLDAILLKALQKKSEERYGSAAALGDDLHRYLTHRPVEARAPGILYQIGKFARRQRVAFLALSALGLVTLAAAAVSSWMAILKERDRAAAEFSAYVANIAAAEAAIRVDDVAEARQRLDETPPRLRNWEWRHLYGRLDASVRTIAAGMRIQTAAISRDGVFLATSETVLPYTIKVWDTAEGAVVREHTTNHGCATALALSSDGRLLAVGYGGRYSGRRGRQVHILDAATGEILTDTAGHASDVNALAFDPTGQLLASASRDRTIKLWETKSGRLLHTLKGHEDRVVCLSFDPLGGKLASGGREGTIRIWDPSTGEAAGIWLGHAGSVDGVAFAPDGSRLASVGRDLTVRVWNAETGGVIAASRGHRGAVVAVAFSPDGRTVASGSYDKTVRLWDAFSGRPLATLRGHTWSLRSLVFVPTGELVSFSVDETIKFWRVAGRKEVPTLRGHRDMVRAVAFGPGGVHLASGSGDGVIRIWDPATRKALSSWLAHRGGTHLLSFGAKGSELLSGGSDGEFRVWSVPDGEPLRNSERAPDGACTATAPGGTVYTGNADGSVVASRRGAVVGSRNLHAKAISALALAPDGLHLASASHDSTIALVDPVDLELRETLRGHAYGVL
jgi:WD40 repeat protein